jgi:Spy/CpxP family protein refolding chaperone
LQVNSWKVILATMVIFAAGVVTGGVLVRKTMLRPERAPHRLQAVQRPPVTFTPGNMRVEFLRRAQRDLELTAEQQARVEEILKRSQERSRKTMEVIAPKLREEVQKTREEFREVLTAEQRAEFDKLWKQRPREQRTNARPNRVERPERKPASAPKSERDQ